MEEWHCSSRYFNHATGWGEWSISCSSFFTFRERTPSPPPPPPSPLCQSQTGHFEEENSLLPLPGIEPQFLSCPVHSVLTIPTMLIYLHGNQRSISKCLNSWVWYCHMNSKSFAVFLEDFYCFYAKLNHCCMFIHNYRYNVQEITLQKCHSLIVANDS